jgi:hypothetical protein
LSVFSKHSRQTFQTGFFIGRQDNSKQLQSSDNVIH